uniref:Uncharacterized protein n=1 Tax=Panagrellus redivivus TaxID=6233 RepID=A0A7E4VUQ0_PANRE
MTQFVHFAVTSHHDGRRSGCRQNGVPSSIPTVPNHATLASFASKTASIPSFSPPPSARDDVSRQGKSPRLRWDRQRTDRPGSCPVTVTSTNSATALQST